MVKLLEVDAHRRRSFELSKELLRTLKQDNSEIIAEKKEGPQNSVQFGFFTRSGL